MKKYKTIKNAKKKPVQKSACVEGHHRLQVDGTEAGRLVGEEEHEADLYFFVFLTFFSYLFFMF
jgi:hypothetical protein